MRHSQTVISQMIWTVVRRLYSIAGARGRQCHVSYRCMRENSTGSEGGGQSDPSQLNKKHSIACGQTQGSIQYWFGSAAVLQNFHEL